MLEPLGRDLWFADGGIVSFFGAAYPTRMVVVRLLNSNLWIWSPIAPTEPILEEVQALGEVSHLVSPNKLHFLFLKAWKTRFPEAKTWGTASTIAKCRDIEFSGKLTRNAPPEWAGQIDQYHFANSRFLDETVFFHHASATAIIADLSQPFSESFRARYWPWWLRKAAKLSHMEEGWGYPPIDLRLSFRNRATARQKIRALVNSRPEHVVVAHGEVVRTDGGRYLEKGFSWLDRTF